MLVKHRNITIQKMKDEDLRLMVKWLNDDQVLAFYDEPPSDWNRIVKKYGPRIEGNHYVTPCIIEYDDQSIGYIQYYEIQPNKLDEYGILLNSDKLYGIDQFIGEPTLWGKGIWDTNDSNGIERIKSQRCHKGVVGSESSKQTGHSSL